MSNNHLPLGTSLEKSVDNPCRFPDVAATEVSSSSALAIVLKRSVRLKRFPVIARVVFRRERADLVSLLKQMQVNNASMPLRLKAYLQREALWNAESYSVTEAGQKVIDSGMFNVSERALYHIWYTDDDELLGTKPVLMQRDTGFFDPDVESWKKGADALRSEFRVDNTVTVDVLEQTFNGGEKSVLKKMPLQLVSLEPEVICSYGKDTQLELDWQLGISYSIITLEGELDTLKFSLSKPVNVPQAFSYVFHDVRNPLQEIMANLAAVHGARWNPEARRIKIPLENIEHEISTIQDFRMRESEYSNLSTDFGMFRSAHAQHIPVQPSSVSDAQQWHHLWLEDFYGNTYRSTKLAEHRQAEWLNHAALNGFGLSFKQRSELLRNFMRKQHPEAYWHVAAMTDLSPGKNE